MIPAKLRACERIHRARYVVLERSEIPVTRKSKASTMVDLPVPFSPSRITAGRSRIQSHRHGRVAPRNPLSPSSVIRIVRQCAEVLLYLVHPMVRSHRSICQPLADSCKRLIAQQVFGTQRSDDAIGHLAI